MFLAPSFPFICKLDYATVKNIFCKTGLRLCCCFETILFWWLVFSLKKGSVFLAPSFAFICKLDYATVKNIFCETGLRLCCCFETYPLLVVDFFLEKRFSVLSPLLCLHLQAWLCHWRISFAKNKKRLGLWCRVKRDSQQGYFQNNIKHFHRGGGEGAKKRRKGGWKKNAPAGAGAWTWDLPRARQGSPAACHGSLDK